jgi:hypothetical protein
VKRLLFCFIPAFAATVSGQDATHSSTLTFGVGGQPYSYNSFDQHGGPAFAGHYEYRFSKYFAVEAGVDTLLPSTFRLELLPVIPSGVGLSSGSLCSACVFVPETDRARVTLLPFGFKGILPVARDRVEFFGGFGGAYAWNSDYGQYRDALLAQASIGGRLAIDRGHRFWLGTSLRGYSNFGAGKQVWTPLTLDLGIRFGH